jgi:hypothetical protein
VDEHVEPGIEEPKVQTAVAELEELVETSYQQL